MGPTSQPCLIHAHTGGVDHSGDSGLLLEYKALGWGSPGIEVERQEVKGGQGLVWGASARGSEVTCLEGGCQRVPGEKPQALELETVLELIWPRGYALKRPAGNWESEMTSWYKWDDK